MLGPPTTSLSTVWEGATTVAYDRCTCVSGLAKSDPELRFLDGEGKI
jgi:hypothetical protein